MRNEMNQGHEKRSLVLNRVVKINSSKQGQAVKASVLHLYPNFPWVFPPGKTVLQPDTQANIVPSFLLH